MIRAERTIMAEPSYGKDELLSVLEGSPGSGQDLE